MHFLSGKANRKIVIVSAAFYLFFCLHWGLEFYVDVLNDDWRALEYAVEEYYRIHQKLPVDAQDFPPPLEKSKFPRLQYLVDIKTWETEDGEIRISAYDTQLFRKVETGTWEPVIKHRLMERSQ